MGTEKCNKWEHGNAIRTSKMWENPQDKWPDFLKNNNNNNYKGKKEIRWSAETSRLKENWGTQQRQCMKFVCVLIQTNCKQMDELACIESGKLELHIW